MRKMIEWFKSLFGAVPGSKTLDSVMDVIHYCGGKGNTYLAQHPRKFRIRVRVVGVTHSTDVFLMLKIRDYVGTFIHPGLRVARKTVGDEMFLDVSAEAAAGRIDGIEYIIEAYPYRDKYNSVCLNAHRITRV